MYKNTSKSLLKLAKKINVLPLFYNILKLVVTTVHVVTTNRNNIMLVCWYVL